MMEWKTQLGIHVIEISGQALYISFFELDSKWEKQKNIKNTKHQNLLHCPLFIGWSVEIFDWINLRPDSGPRIGYFWKAMAWGMEGTDIGME